MLRKIEAEKMFRENSVLIKDRDVMPREIAERLTSKAAVDFTRKIEQGKYYNGYGIGDYTIFCLTEQGFYVAITYCNIVEYKKILEDMAR